MAFALALVSGNDCCVAAPDADDVAAPVAAPDDVADDVAVAAPAAAVLTTVFATDLSLAVAFDVE